MKSQFNDHSSIDDIFREGLKDYQTPAPKGMWGKINSRLSANARQTFPLPLYMAASVFIAALLAVGFWSINSHNSANKESAKIINSKPANSVPVTSNTTTIVQLRTNPTQTQNATTGYTRNIAKQESLSVDKKTNALAENEAVNSSLNSTPEPVSQMQPSSIQLQDMPSKPIGVLAIPGSQDINYDYIQLPKTTLSVATLSNKNIKGFYAGINGSANNVWILDRVALHDNNFDYQPTLGFTYGMQAGYNFSDNFGLESGVTINARDGQKYITYINALVPVNKSVVLNYTEIPLVAKFKIPQISAFTGMPVVLNLNAGFSYGYLRSAYTFVEGDKAGSQNQYPTDQLNALAGFSYDIYTGHPYSFSFGLMAEYGINTIDNDNQGSTSSLTPTPTISRYVNGSDFISPHNLSVGITVAVNYNFSLFRR